MPYGFIRRASTIAIDVTSEPDLCCRPVASVLIIQPLLTRFHRENLFISRESRTRNCEDHADGCVYGVQILISVTSVAMRPRSNRPVDNPDVRPQ